MSNDAPRVPLAPPPAPPPATISKSTKALIGVVLGGLAGIIVLIAHFSSDSVPRLGPRTAAAACTSGYGCLPEVTFVDTNGTAYTHESLRGKVVIVNFWATWCSPCIKEIPDLSRVSMEYKDRDVVVFGVLVEDGLSAASLLNFQSDHDMQYPVIRSTPEIMNHFRWPSSLPTTFVFDKAGRLVDNKPHLGALSADDLKRLLAPLIGAS